MKKKKKIEIVKKKNEFYWDHENEILAPDEKSRNNSPMARDYRIPPKRSYTDSDS